MTDSSGSLEPVDVDVLCLSLTPPLICKGRITSREAGFYEVVLEEAQPALETGMRVVLDGGPSSGVRLVGMIGEKKGARLRVEAGRVIEPDKRAFPRMPGGIRLRYRVLSEAERAAVARAWVKGEEGPNREGTWHEPDPFMDFSGSGLRFEDRLHCREDDLLLVELDVPPSGTLWRAVARVVRVTPLDPGEGAAADGGREGPAPSHQIAVHFEDLPAGAREALTAFTLRIQNALLGIGSKES